jgi:hypothetical protein
VAGFQLSEDLMNPGDKVTVTHRGLPVPGTLVRPIAENLRLWCVDTGSAFGDVMGSTIPDITGWHIIPRESD